MTPAFWNTAIAIGIVQALFFGVTLLLQRHTNRRAARWLALLACALALGMLASLVARSLPPSAALLVMFANVNTELTLGPLLYLFVRAVVDPARRWRARDALLFLPYVAGLVTWCTAWYVIDDPGVVADGGLDALAGAGAFLAFKAAVLFAYIAMACRLLSRASATARPPARRELDADWLRRWILRLCPLPAAIYLLTFLEQQELAPSFEADEVGGLLITVIVFLTAAMVLLRPSVLVAKRAAGGNDARQAAQLTAYLERERPWLDPELGLGDLADALGLSENRLSAVINDGLDTSFYALLNRYRLAEFRRLAGDPALEQRSVLDLAFDAGFNSKAAFYRAFREAYATTPTEFRSEQLAAASR